MRVQNVHVRPIRQTLLGLGRIALILSLTAIAALVSCKQTRAPSTRSFSMGFTTYPYGIDPADTESVSYTAEKLHAYGDIVAFHFDSGIPWNEALAGTVGSSSRTSGIRLDLEAKKAQAKAGGKVYVGLSALDGSRTGLAGYRDDDGDSKPLQSPWNGYGFDEPDVSTAYENYCSFLIDALHPDYFNYGIEGNSEHWSDADFSGYSGFCSRVYEYLRGKYPGQKLLVSCMVNGNSVAEARARALMPCSDYIGVSIYPFMYLDPVKQSGGSYVGNADPGAYPSDWLSRVQSYAPGKRIAVCETGMIAEDLDIRATSFPLLKRGTESWQTDYVNGLLSDCDSLKAEFVIWWEIRDYDAGWQWLNEHGVTDPFLSVWKDTGLIDGAGHERSSLAAWKNWLDKTRRDAP